MSPKLGVDDAFMGGLTLDQLRHLQREELPAVPAPSLTDVGNVQRFTTQHASQVRYCYELKSWYVWDEARWRRDPGDVVARLAKDTAKSIYVEAGTIPSEERRKATAQWAAKSEDERRLRAMVTLARSEPGIPVSPDNLDAGPWLLNVANGTLNLKAGVLQPHRREDLITRIIPVTYDIAATCATWENFLTRILTPNVTRFLQKAIGYSLTGETREQVLFLLHGVGANGKTTLLETIGALLHPYAARVAAETLLARSGNTLAMNDLSTLQGARFVVAIESDADRRLAENLVKQVTGGDTIKAKKLYVDIFAFRPEFKLFLATNHRPVIRGTDHAISRRIRLVEFGVVIADEKQDKTLPGKLRAELPGILRWAVEGCRAWREEGLGQPEEVRAAGEAYRAEQDTLGIFLSEHCRREPGAEVTFDALFTSYDTWAYRAKEKALSEKRFSLALKERGFEQTRRAAGRVWLGIRLRTAGEPDSVGSASVSGCAGLGDKLPSRVRVPEVPRDTRHNPTLALNPTSDPLSEGTR
jgi:putative DNA primase/helicase